MPGALPLGSGDSGTEQGELGVGFGATGRDLAAELDRLRAYTLSLGRDSGRPAGEIQRPYARGEHGGSVYPECGHATAAGRRTEQRSGNSRVAGTGHLIGGVHTSWRR